MSTTTGRTAEDLAAAHLESLGWHITDRNWCNRWCELDLVAIHKGRVHVVEVKYRKTTEFGGGLDYITRDKIRRLRNAAIMWASAHHHTGDMQIDVVTVTGSLASPVIELEENLIEG